MLFQLRNATIKARIATGDKHISTQIEQGLIDIVRAVPPSSGRGRYTVTILHAGLTPKQAVAKLEAMQ